MTRLAWLLLALVAVWSGAAGVLVDVATALPPEVTGLGLAVVLAAWCAYRADRPAGYGGMLPRYVR